MHHARQHLPLIACIALSSLPFLLPLRPGAAPPPPDLPPPTASAPAEASFMLGSSAQGRVGLGQGRIMSDVETVMPLAVEVTGLRADTAASRTLVLCVDRSGSMSGAPIRHARSAAHALVDALGPGDEVALVSFSADAEVDLPVMRATDEGKRAAHAAVDRLAAHGGTNLHGGLGLALRQARDGSGGLKRVVLVSDGNPTEGDTRPRSITALATQAAGSGVSVTALGVGAQAPGGLMEQVAVSGAGMFRFVRDASSLGDALAAELSDSARVAVRGVRVDVELPRGAEVLSAEGAAMEVSRGALASRVSLVLGDVPVGQVRRALLSVRMVVPRGDVAAFGVGVAAVHSSGALSAHRALGAVGTTDAAESAMSAVTWVGAQAVIAEASREMRSAAETLSRGDMAGGRAGVVNVAQKLEDKAKKDASYAPAARKMRALAEEVNAAPAASMAANAAHEGAFDLGR